MWRLATASELTMLLAPGTLTWVRDAAHLDTYLADWGGLDWRMRLSVPLGKVGPAVTMEVRRPQGPAPVPAEMWRRLSPEETAALLAPRDLTWVRFFPETMYHSERGGARWRKRYDLSVVPMVTLIDELIWPHGP